MTITELNLAASALLESHYNDVEIEGEISRFIRHSSGHWYFVLKDEKSSISATWKLSNQPNELKISRQWRFRCGF